MKVFCNHLRQLSQNLATKIFIAIIILYLQQTVMLNLKARCGRVVLDSDKLLYNTILQKMYVAQVKKQQQQHDIPIIVQFFLKIMTALDPSFRWFMSHSLLSSRS